MAKKKKIMVVDDELDIRIFVSTLLETSGYAPYVASHGLEGIEKVREVMPDLVILDVMMPKQGGVQMYREIKTDEKLRHIPVIILSGISKKTFYHSQNVLDSYLGQSIPEPDAYIEKPPEPDELLECVERLLGSEPADKGSR
ncbi:MAG: response regulator [Deltaproteobacteria bacterium]|nr:response regulator [Deltaproteobacteria bacterium]MBW2016297.1 response regulator [Deltaproteobacteria bacterium]MBW2129253.1 response regulator [Deltaproteobacteria bacterium]MBW2304354.1 response regulator [Deltaproteobacteria bacterium]